MIIMRYHEAFKDSLPLNSSLNPELKGLSTPNSINGLLHFWIYYKKLPTKFKNCSAITLDLWIYQEQKT